MNSKPVARAGFQCKHVLPRGATPNCTQSSLGWWYLCRHPAQCNYFIGFEIESKKEQRDSLSLCSVGFCLRYAKYQRCQTDGFVDFMAFFSKSLRVSADRSITNAPAACLEYSHSLDCIAYIVLYDCFQSPGVINMYPFPRK